MQVALGCQELSDRHCRKPSDSVGDSQPTHYFETTATACYQRKNPIANLGRS